MPRKIQLVMYEGYLAEDPIMRATDSGLYVTNFRMGSNRKYKTSAGQAVTETTWLKVTAWGKLGEIVNEWCEKGSHVIVTGILRVNPETGSPNVYQLKSGDWAASNEITASEVRILKGKARSESPLVAEPEEDEENIPF